MRNLYSIIASLVFLSMTISCNVQNKANSKKEVYPLKTENFTFIATKSDLDGYNYKVEEISRGGNSWDNPPNFRQRQTFVRSRTQLLDSGYSVSVTKNELEVTLPFFGQIGKNWTVNPSRTIQEITVHNGVIHFTSSDFTVDQKINKKGNMALTIIANDITNPITIKMEVFDDGKTNVVFETGVRKSSSYAGYVKNKNSIAKN